jgi:branched-chain amino acid transport system substrate-binding protein
MMRSIAWAALFAIGAASTAAAQISNDVVKIGVLTDQSGVFSSLAGRGSVVAARMAVDDVGGMVSGKRVEVVDADHQTRRMWARRSRGAGSTSTAST